MPLHFPQFLRFLVIGCAAFVVHFLIVKQCVALWSIPPLIANILAFLTAFQVSYWGHYKWTFQASHLPYKATVLRFLMIGCVSFLLGEALYALALTLTPLSYDMALFIVLATTAIFTFILSKLWAFR